MLFCNFRKVPKFSDTRKICCNLSKIQTKRSNLRVFCQNDVNGIANSEDPDQTAPLGLFAQTYLSENFIMASFKFDQITLVRKDFSTKPKTQISLSAVQNFINNSTSL